MAGQHPGVVVEYQQFGDDRAEQIPSAATREVGAADGPLEQCVAGEDEARAFAGHPEGHRPPGMSRRVVDGHRDPVEVQHRSVPVQIDDLPRLPKQRAEHDLPDPRAEAPDRVGEHEPVLRVDESGASIGVGHLLRRPDVVDVAMGEQHRSRSQPVLVKNPTQRSKRTLTGVDNDRIRPGARRQDIAVTGQHAGREPGEQHGDQSDTRHFGWVLSPVRILGWHTRQRDCTIYQRRTPRCPRTHNDAKLPNASLSGNWSAAPSAPSVSESSQWSVP